MGCYTLSHCVLVNLDSGKKYITDLLMVFTQEKNSFKVALDKSHRIIDLYEEAGQNNQIVATWLQLMSYMPTNFEIINIDTSSAKNEEELFLSVCSSIKSQNKLIIYSHERWQHFKYNSERVIYYNNIPILIFDRDEAIHELNATQCSTINAYNSVIATDKSTIKDVSH